MSKQLREIAESAQGQRTARIADEYVMPEPGAFVGEHTKFVVIEPATVLALLDVAEAAEVVSRPGFDHADYAALDDALNRLREVAP